MTKTRRMSKRRAAVAVAALAMLFAGRGPASAADPLTEEQIVKALTPITTRSLTLAPADSAATADKKLLDSLRNRPAHSLTPGEREQIAAAAAAKPSKIGRAHV